MRISPATIYSRTIDCRRRRAAADSDADLALHLQIKHIAPRLATVLIEGETGVGKEMTARELTRKAFVPTNPSCRSIARPLPASDRITIVRARQRIVHRRRHRYPRHAAVC